RDSVGELHAAAHRERPRPSIGRRRPLGGQPRLGRHVLHRVAGEVVIGQAPHLGRRGLEPQERVQGVDPLAQHRDVEDHLVLALGRSADREPGQQCGQQESERGQEGTGGTVTAVPTPTPPTAARRPFTHTEHGVERPDPYHWLGGNEPAVLDHLVAERAFYDASVAHLQSLGSTLKAEMLSRLPTDDESARWSRRRFSYWTRHPVNSDYVELRRLNHASGPGSTTESESSSLFFDVNAQ